VKRDQNSLFTAHNGLQRPLRIEWSFIAAAWSLVLVLAVVLGIFFEDEHEDDDEGDLLGRRNLENKSVVPNGMPRL